MPHVVANIVAIAFGLIALLHALRAPEGFENSDGFHYK